MASRRIQRNEMYFVLTNLGTQRIAVAGRSIGPAQSLRVPTRYIAGAFQRCSGIAQLMNAGKLAVALIGEYAGFNAPVNLTASYMMALQANTAGPLGMNPVLTTATRPAATMVPEGFAIYNDTTTIPNYSDGTAYLDAAGAPA